jgi:serine/threonine protein kinase
VATSRGCDAVGLAVTKSVVRSAVGLTWPGGNRHALAVVGHRIGEYELVRRIGSGGMAEVWMGQRAVVGGATKSVAIKFMAASMASSARHRKMFLDEARLSMLLSHSNVVQVFDAGLDGERMYMVMEWVDGLNLSQIVQLARASGQGISLAVVGYVIGEVLQGLSYAHELRHEGRQLGIVHRDISPHNVLVSLSGEVKLADFGVARLATDETSGVHIKGKLRYMAPEHLAGRTKSAKVDLFGVGAILHELLTGDRFRAEADEVALYHQILGGITPPLPRADVPPELVALRLGLLEPDENQRLPSADAALQLLEAWPGYRNAAGELARMCRGFTGVDAPRSGLHARAREVDALANTESPTAPTHTSLLSASAREPTGPHGEGRTPHPGDVSTVWTGPPPSPARRVAWIVAGIGGAIVLATASAYGVKTMLRKGDDAAVVADATPANAETKAEPAKVEPEPDEPERPELGPIVDAKAIDAKAVDAKADAKTPDAKTPDAEAPEPTSDEATPPKPAEPASKPSAKKPKPTAAPVVAKVKVAIVFRLKSPLRFAWARIDGGEGFALEPTAKRTVTAGSHSIDWRADESKPWVSGGRFDIVAGSSPTIRIGPSGPQLE